SKARTTGSAGESPLTPARSSRYCCIAAVVRAASIGSLLTKRPIIRRARGIDIVCRCRRGCRPAGVALRREQLVELMFDGAQPLQMLAHLRQKLWKPGAGLFRRAARVQNLFQKLSDAAFVPHDRLSLPCISRPA